MGGIHTEQSVDVRWRVVVCVDDGDVLDRVTTALLDAELDVTSSRLADVVEVVGSDPAVLMLDDRTPGWLGCVAKLTAAAPNVRPLLIADLAGPDDFLSALAAGVGGFCPTDASPEALRRTIDSLVESGVAIPRAFVSPLVDEVRRGRGRAVHTAAGVVLVTDREWEILQMLIQGRSTREMSDALFVSVGTVRSHVSTLLKKMGAVDRDDAVSLIRRGDRPVD